jgi:protein-tyrosine phosphatase
VTTIWERLYLGELKDAQRLARSNPQRINTVIALCREQTVDKAAKITYIRIPISDSCAISAQRFEDIMFAIAVGVRRGNVLVHCFAGLSRSPVLIAAWLDRCGYAAIDKALAQIAQLRDIAPSRVLLKSVQDLVRN